MALVKRQEFVIFFLVIEEVLARRSVSRILTKSYYPLLQNNPIGCSQLGITFHISCSIPEILTIRTKGMEVLSLAVAEGMGSAIIMGSITHRVMTISARPIIVKESTMSASNHTIEKGAEIKARRGATPLKNITNLL